MPVQIEISFLQPMEAECSKENPSPNKKKVKRWKRAAREAEKISPARLIASPLHRMLGVNKQARRSPKGNVRSSSGAKFSPNGKNGSSSHNHLLKRSDGLVEEKLASDFGEGGDRWSLSLA
ncbi:hypothetical protein LWI29_036178 [Acer saccharum]|uniref:Uncharacterized protein n=1 Tax=Acer saccharum TaxID=4024 RepID=A0AA39VKM6_ACESA|nr:hypothetical protein LWI29_036178 [Acer saccharum]